MAVMMVTLDQIKALVKEGVGGNYEKLQEAENLLIQMINRNPDNWMALFLLSGIYLHTDKNGLAIAILRTVDSLQPGISEVYNNIGTAYRKENQYIEAERWLLKASELRPEDADVWNNLGTLFVNEGNPEKGIEYLDKALELEPFHQHAHWNRGLCYLEAERWGEGFDEYVWGLSTKDRMNKNYGTAVWWDGKPHKDKTLVVYGEQGIGDEIMFMSALRETIDHFEGKVILDAHPRLTPMFKRNFPDIEVYPTRKEIFNEPDWVKKAKPHYKCAAASMFKFFRREDNDFPKTIYLNPDREKVEEYKQWLKALGNGPYFGLTWTAGHKKTRKDVRAFHIETYLPLFKAFPDATYVSFQYSDHSEQVDELAEKHGIKVHHFAEVVESKRWEKWYIKDEEGDRIAQFDDKRFAKQYLAQQLNKEKLTIEHVPGNGYDYDETLALACAVDELNGVQIAPNTSLVHLCGAAGLRMRTMTPNRPAWRYGLTRDDMAMYGRWVKQYRQGKEPDWGPVLDRIIDDLKGEYSDQ